MKDERLMVARGELVAKYRAHSGSWPDGIDNQYDRWYRPEEWTDEGAFIGDNKTDDNKADDNSLEPTDDNKPQMANYRGKEGQLDRSAYQRDLMRWRRAQK
jgi:hypothetical protein